MIRRHSTRLSQAHDEEPEESQGHTAARDYPELGTILTDRPDPGGVITVIGMRRQGDAYGTPDDARDEDYNGGEGGTGTYWAEPAQQAWVHENVGPQEEAPPPLFDQEISPVMARLAALEEAQAFFGMSHHATTINGTQVDDAGDAPEHGTVPRAEDPDSYDSRSLEGTGDPKWDDPLPWGDKDKENAATVGMYPEGVSAGGGPGISVGPVVASSWEDRPDLVANVHGRMVTRAGLVRHMEAAHGHQGAGSFPDGSLRYMHASSHAEGGEHTPGWEYDLDQGEPREDEEPTWGPMQGPSQDEPDWGTAATYHPHQGPIDPVFGSRRQGALDLARHMQEDHNFPHQYPGMTIEQERMLAEDHAALHEYGGAGHEHDDIPGAWELGADASGGHQFTGTRHEARVPWTGKERGTLHRWQENPEGATWGDFVPSSEFPLLDPGESVHHVEPGEGLAPVEATSDRQWEEHLRHRHGWDDNRIEQARQAGSFRGAHEALHQLGLPDHRHAGGPEDARDEARHSSEDNMFGPAFPRRTPQQMPLARPELGGSSREDPETSLLYSREARPPVHPDEYYQADPARFRRMMSALNVHVRIDGKELPAQEHEHDDAGNSLDHDADKDPDSHPGKNSQETASPQAGDGGSLDTPQDSPQDGSQDQPRDGSQGFGDPEQWPQAGADVNERDRAYTQGSGDGKVKRGAPAPGPFSPGDGDSGGGGDQGDDPDDGDQPDDEDTPFSKDGALAMFTAAAASPSFRFQFTATWSDVVAKARRIRSEGHVRIVHASAGMVIGEVRGDHDTYESGIQRPVGRRQAMAHWACGCPWASFHQKSASRRRYSGRPCSHVMALQFEAQSRGMFGRSFEPDAGEPAWAPPTVVVKSWPPYEGDPHAGKWREEWRTPGARQRTAGAGLPYYREPDDDGTLAAHVVHHHGLGADNMAAAMEAGADDAHWRRWHASEHQHSTALTHQHNEPREIPGEHHWPDLFEPESGFTFDDHGGREVGYPPEGSFGGVRHEKFQPTMEPHWGSLGAPGDRAAASLARAGEDPDTVGALCLLAGMRATADQANGPWGAQNVSQHPPQKPYGATEPPNKDQDPGSYGFLAAPDPDNWGSIQDNSAYQMPITNTAAHQVLVPGAPRPEPGDLHWPSVQGWQPEDQGTFGYTDRASTAGPSTAMTPRDPNGIRMEEARRATAAGTPFPYHGEVPQLDGALAELRDEPEGALPETTADEPVTASLDPSVVGDPGGGMQDDDLTPDDQSIQTIGNQQWSGGGADSDEVAVPAGEPQGGIDDIIASFQRSAASSNYSPEAPRADGDIAAAAREYLSKTAEALPRDEADELIREGSGGGRARNLDLLRLEGTHYEEEDGEMARRGLSLEDYDDDVMFA